MLCNPNHLEGGGKEDNFFLHLHQLSRRCLLTCPSFHRPLNKAVQRDCPQPFEIKYSDLNKDCHMKSTFTKGSDDRQLGIVCSSEYLFYTMLHQSMNCKELITCHYKPIKQTISQCRWCHIYYFCLPSRLIGSCIQGVTVTFMTLPHTTLRFCVEFTLESRTPHCTVQNRPHTHWMRYITEGFKVCVACEPPAMRNNTSSCQGDGQESDKYEAVNLYMCAFTAALFKVEYVSKMGLIPFMSAFEKKQWISEICVNTCGCVVAERRCSTGRQWGALSAVGHGRRSRKRSGATVHRSTASSSSDPNKAPRNRSLWSGVHKNISWPSSSHH